MPFFVSMPKLSPTMEEGAIAKWLKKEGDYVKASDIFVEIATDKATIEFAALDEGFLRKILVPEGKIVPINQPIAIFTVDAQENIENFSLPKSEVKEQPREKSLKSEAPLYATAYTTFAPEPPLKEYHFEEPSDEIPVSPLAKKMAEEKGLDLKSVKGSGSHGRITSSDLEFALPKGIVSFGRDQKPKDPPGTYVEEDLMPMRKTIGLRLQASKSSIPHFYVTQKINASPLVKLREELKNLKMEKVTFNDMILRGTAIALTNHPAINTGFNSQSQKIIRFKTIDISVAVTLEGGLVTPIIRHANYKNLGEISSEMRKLSAKAKAQKLKEEEYKGGSFSISNLGMYGISDFIAVINPPQGAILAIGGIQEEPIVKEGAIVVGQTLSLSISCDHRVIDGTEAAKFLKTLKEILENPISLII